MKTLVVYYSKTGHTKTAAEKVIEKLRCDFDELIYDDVARTVKSSRDPAEYERIVLLSPIWAFGLAEPMKRYLKEHGGAIKSYSLIVTCLGLGLRGCVAGCRAATGKKPEAAQKIRASDIEAGKYEISAV